MKVNQYIVLKDKETSIPFLKKINQYNNYTNNDEKEIVDFLNENFYMDMLNEEYVYIIVYNTQLIPIGVFEFAHGSDSEAHFSLKTLGTLLLLTGASSFIVAHNHPSGSLVISDDDQDLTNKILQMVDYLDIELTQHFIISKEGFNTIIDTSDLPF